MVGSSGGSVVVLLMVSERDVVSGFAVVVDRKTVGCVVVTRVVVTRGTVVDCEAVVVVGLTE